MHSGCISLSAGQGNASEAGPREDSPERSLVPSGVPPAQRLGHFFIGSELGSDAATSLEASLEEGQAAVLMGKIEVMEKELRSLVPTLADEKDADYLSQELRHVKSAVLANGAVGSPSGVVAAGSTRVLQMHHGDPVTAGEWNFVRARTKGRRLTCSCGYSFASSVKFCGKCGTRLSGGPT
jgi:hypothetical protein